MRRSRRRTDCKPKLVVLRLGAGAQRERGFCETLHAQCASAEAAIFCVRDTATEDADGCSAEHCLANDAAFGREMTTIVKLLRGAHADY